MPPMPAAGGTPEGIINWQVGEIGHKEEVKGLTSKGQDQHHPDGLNHIVTEWKDRGREERY